ncbi:hypothetical protein HYDPIDRAFT_108689 [Hydnomerulius pinastri MD-312]|nr:hypothetical protein HYDPIDRAFT_108689 [Hydnomerulius pinastri MD-312]
MADRMPQYPMFSQNLMQNSLQQQQIQQQPQQQQQTDSLMIPGLSNPENGRIWQQMNQQMNQYRAQSNDIAAAQMNHQMQEFARGQALSHGQGQQPIVQQIQQSFGLNAQRMNAPGPPFHDAQGNQSQPLIPPNFNNMSMNTQQQMKAGFNRNAMMQAAAMNPNVSRQLQLMVAQGQQNQQAPNAMDLARLQQAGLGVQHGANQASAADLFASSSIQPNQDQMHGSPHPAAQPVGQPGGAQGMMHNNQQVQNAQRRVMTLAEYQERRGYLQNAIAESEKALVQVANARANGAPEHLVAQRVNALRAELAGRKDLLNKITTAINAAAARQGNGMLPAGMAQINQATASPSPSHQQAAVANAQGQSGFMPPGNQASAQQFNANPQSNGPSPMPTHLQNQTPINQQIPGQMGRPNAIPPRTGATPHLMPGGQLPNTMPLNLGNQFAMQNGQMVPNQLRQSTGIMPLDKQRFDMTYAQFCHSQHLDPSLRVTLPDSRMVDLHQLHVHVLREGGSASVTQRDLWSVIGGRMGFVQFPGSESEPARSGPGIATHLAHTYKQYLQHFENAYIQTVQKRAGGSTPQQMNSMASGSGPKVPMPVPSPAEAPSNAPRQAGLSNPQVIHIVARFATTSKQDMRAQGVPENLIGIVEANRGHLIKYQQQQQAQLLAKRNAEQEQQQGMANAQGQFPNMHEQMSVGTQPGVQRPQPPMPSSEQKPMNAQFLHGMPAGMLKQPTQDQIQHAVMAIASLKQMFQQRSLNGMQTQQIPDDQRLEYNQVLEQVFKMTSDLETKLHMYHAVFKNEDLLRKFVAIVMTVSKQRHLVSTGSPQYIVTLVTLRSMQMQIQKLNEEFETRWHSIKMAAAVNAQQHPPAPPATRQTAVASHPIPPVQQNTVQPPSQTISVPPINSRQVSINPPPQQQQPQTQQHPQLPPQPIKKPNPPTPPIPAAPANVVSPTPPPPVASASTPAASVATPQTTAGSPQTPKSPKVATRPKVAPRVRKSPTTAKGPATLEAVPPSVVGVKRAAEDDVAALTHAAPSEAEASNAPSPKKVKTEWEGEPSEALVKRQQEIESIKTEDDATAFMDRMKELFAMTASTDNDIHNDIASTLDQILAGVAQDPADAAATAAALSAHGAGDAGPPPTALSPHMGPANDAFLEFIDFSSFATLEDEDSDSKAATPDLVPSSETNLSPESGSEGDPSGSTSSPDKTKIEDPSDHLDLLRLGSLREIDGGESVYYQTDNWKWEGSMPTLDQPWAMFTS